MRRAWEQGRGGEPGNRLSCELHHRCAQRIKDLFSFCNHGNRYQFCRGLSHQFYCMLVCLLKLAHVANFFLSDFGKLLDELQPLFYMPFLIQFAWNFITTIAQTIMAWQSLCLEYDITHHKLFFSSVQQADTELQRER